MNDIDISVVINAHREGLVAAPTLRSVDQAIAHAKRTGVTVQTICVLDKSDLITRELFLEWAVSRDNTQVILLEVGDLGIARNSAVSLAHGKWVAFLDGDDLWCNNWLSAAYAASQSEKSPTVWHPEINLFFGARPHVFIHADMDDLDFDVALLLNTNLWTSLCFAPRSLLSEIPYPKTDFELQIGYEDWGWHLETIAQGARHKTVLGTVHGIRTKAISLVGRTTAANCLPIPTNLYRDILDRRLIHALSE